MDDLSDSVMLISAGGPDELIAAPTRPGARIIVTRIVVSCLLTEDIVAQFLDAGSGTPNTLFPTVSISDTATVPIYDSGLMEWRLPVNTPLFVNASISGTEAYVFVQYKHLG